MLLGVIYWANKLIKQLATPSQRDHKALTYRLFNRKAAPNEPLTRFSAEARLETAGGTRLDHSIYIEETDSLKPILPIQRGILPEEVIAAQAKGIPTGRLGNPAEFGAACAFLCSASAGYITGQNLLFDGGGFPGVV